MNTRPLSLHLLLVIAFAIAMANVEATVVVYIRQILGWIPVPADIGPDAIRQVPDDLIFRERLRETATIVMLATFSLAAARRWLQRVGTFLVAFAVWDIFYYVWLYVLIRWPPTLTTMDCLFLIPEPWLAPVWFPLTVSVALFVAGIALLVVGGRPAG
ncbi:MAG: hypothetical protein ACE5O2_01565 [Armatimonadota bacterium]